MRILVVSGFYVPEAVPRAHRWTSICQEWAKQGHDVHVVTRSVAASPREERLGGVAVSRVGSPHLNAVRAWATERAPAGVVRFKRTIRSVHDRTWRQLYWPDGACLWVVPAMRRATQLCATAHPDLLVTASLPFSAHVVGLMIKRRVPALPWLADSGDPFCFLEEAPPNNFRLYRRLNRRAERAVLRRASRFVVTTEATARIYGHLFPEFATKIQTIPALLGNEFLRPRIRSRTLFEPGKIVAVYMGGWYRGVRDPAALLGLFERALRHSATLRRSLELHFLGASDPVRASLHQFPELASRVVVHGAVSRDAAVDAMSQADLLVNVGNRTAYQLPSKLIEYVATGKPILNIAGSEGDSSIAFLEGWATCHNVVPGMGEDLRSTIAFIEASPRLSRDADVSEEFLQRHSASRIAAEYLASLRN